MNTRFRDPRRALLRDYFHAKDENRPHLLAQVFTESARLTVANRSANIAFPAQVTGREAIAEWLVRDFCRTYENIYSFYVGEPEGDAPCRCDWLVVMTDKQDRRIRVGCGGYEWTFAGQGSNLLACDLVISVEWMQLLDGRHTQEVYRWLATLGYPWMARTSAAATWPSIDGLDSVRGWLLRHDRPGSG